MTRTTLRHGLVLLAGISASFGLIGSALADGAYPAVLQLAPGIGGPKEKNGGPGNEQIHAAVFVNEGKQYVVSIYMSSNVDENDGYWQCKCTSTLMDPVVGPVTVYDQVQLTHNGGSRPCNHPRIASNGADYGVWTYGTNENNGNTRTYVQGINHKCELVTDRVRISENNNQNEGAPHIEYIDNDWFLAGYLSTANNDLDAAYAVGVQGSMQNGTATVEKMMHWGAELSQDEAALLVRYLSARYHPGAPDQLPSLESEADKGEVLKPEPASTGPNCQACHGAGASGGVGPKLAGNPILKHEGAFWETVLYGRGAMPAWGSALSQQDIADVHAWLMAQ